MSKKITLRDCIFAALFAALISILGYVSIPLPFSPVPITGQTLAIMLAGSILTTRQAAMSVSTFLLLGIVGVPVFAGGASGPGIIAGQRGGYLIGFLAGTIVITLLRGSNNNGVRLALSNVVGGIVVIYILGVTWSSFVTGNGIYETILIGALPYIPLDLFKAFAATLTAVAVNKQVKHLVEA